MNAALRGGVHRVARAGGLALSLLLLGSTQASALGAEASERLVRETFYEGLPLERAAQIDAAGAARLARMLDDPSERAHHANVLMALAASGQPEAFAAIVRWAATEPTGEVDRATFRARQTLPYALGELARHDARALPLLAAQLDGGLPGWRFRHHTPERIAKLTRRGAATGLGMSGRAEADALLAQAEATSDGEDREHLRAARALHRARTRGSR